MVATLERIPGVDVHHTDPPTGRIVATIEAGTVEGEVETLERIQRMPGIVLAEMVQHHIDVEPAAEPGGVPKTSVDTTRS